MRFGRGTVVAAAIFSVVTISAAGCVGPDNVDPTRVQVLTSTTVLADLVSNVGGSFVQVTSLVPKNADVHTFEPRPSDVVAASHAKLIVMNGLGLDNWLDKTVQNASADGKTIKLGEGLPGVALLPGETPDTQNPHLFLDPKYVVLYVNRILAGLESVDPAHKNAYETQAANYRGALDTLDSWVRSEIGTIPPEARKLVTFHDAFPYYAREYGIQIVGVAVKAPGQDPNAGYIAKLISAIKSAGVRAIFSEAQFPAKLVDQLASEANCKVVANLYDDTLGDPPVTSYDALIRWDTTQLVDALR